MELTRKDIKSYFPGDVKISLKTISFSDLARGEAVKLHIYRDGKELPSMLDSTQLEAWKDIIDARKKVIGNHYKGKRII